MTYEVTEQSVQSPGQGAGRHDGGGEHQGGGLAQGDQQTQEEADRLKYQPVRAELFIRGFTSNFIVQPALCSVGVTRTY